METGLHLIGDDGMEFHLKQVGKRAVDLRTPLRRVGRMMLDDEEELFRRRGATSEHPPWDALRRDTIQRKGRAGYPFPDMPLIATGDMMRSLSKKGHPNNIFNVSRTAVHIGSRDPHLGFHVHGWVQTTGRGLVKGTTTVAPRPPIRITEKQESEYTMVIHDYIFDKRGR